jgi:hypothetical protein
MESMSSSLTYVRLGRHDVVSERPFSHPDHSMHDLHILQRMTQALLKQVQQLNLPWQRRHPLVVYLREAEGHYHRQLIVDPGGLLHEQAITVVGFFGHKRNDVDGKVLSAVDAELSKELLHHPLLLSYSSLAIGGGNWGNLVLMRHPEGIDQWSTSPRHAYAAQVLAPTYYDGIRLHNGVLPQGILQPEGLQLLRTKYYQYHDGLEVWRALRESA